MASSLPVETPPAIRIRSLVKRFDDVVAVDGLDLDVRSGECFGLLGPNGAGKTTTIEILEGLQKPTSGDVLVLERSWEREPRELRARIGVQLQETVLPGKLQVREAIRLFASFYPQARPVDVVLAEVGLVEKARTWVEKLSGGQKQRLAVACALVSDPEILFLDEPTTGLDPAARRALWDILRAFQGRGRTILLTTHYMDEAERLCDRIGIMDRGRLAALGTPRELVARVGGEEVVELETDVPVAESALQAVPGVTALRPDGRGWRLATRGLSDTVPAILACVASAGARPSRLSTRRATLDDVFLEVTGRRFEEAEQPAAAPA